MHFNIVKSSLKSTDMPFAGAQNNFGQKSVIKAQTLIRLSIISKVN